MSFHLLLCSPQNRKEHLTVQSVICDISLTFTQLDFCCLLLLYYYVLKYNVTRALRSFWQKHSFIMYSTVMCPYSELHSDGGINIKRDRYQRAHLYSSTSSLFTVCLSSYLRTSQTNQWGIVASTCLSVQYSRNLMHLYDWIIQWIMN